MSEDLELDDGYILEENVEFLNSLFDEGLTDETVGLIIYAYYRMGGIDKEDLDYYLYSVNAKVASEVESADEDGMKGFNLQKINYDFITALMENRMTPEFIIDLYTEAITLGKIDKESVLALVEYYNDPEIVSFDEAAYESWQKEDLHFINIISIKIIIDNAEFEGLKPKHIYELLVRLYRDKIIDDFDLDVGCKYLGLKRK